MAHLKAYKFRIYPNNEQALLIAKTIGCCRFVYNYALGEQKKYEDRYKLVNEMIQQGYFNSNEYKAGFFQANESKKWLPELKSNHVFLKEVDSIALQSAIEDLNNGYTKYYTDKEVGHPHFRSKKNHKGSYTTKLVSKNISILDNKHIKLPKLGIIKIKMSRDINGNIKRVTISKTSSGKYYISILAEVNILNLPKSSKKIGLDLGIKHYAIDSNGNTYENYHPYRDMEQNIIRLQKSLSRKKPGSNRYNKSRTKLAKLYEYIANKRTDYLQKLSTKLIHENQVIVLEDLSIKDMMFDNDLAKDIADVSWAKFRSMLEYKADWYGREIIIAPKYFASTQICSHCQEKNPDTKNLSIRKWVCVSCGTIHDRDVNAAKNLLSLAG